MIPNFQLFEYKILLTSIVRYLTALILVIYAIRSTKTADKRILLFTNEDDPFGNIKGVTKLDMMRTTIQRAKVMCHSCSCA